MLCLKGSNAVEEAQRARKPAKKVEKNSFCSLDPRSGLCFRSPLRPLLRLDSTEIPRVVLGRSEARKWPFRRENGGARTKKTSFRLCFRPLAHLSPLPKFTPGLTSENVAARYGVGRDVQDKLAARSHARAAAAQAAGRFRDEIVPVKTKIVDPKTEEENAIVVSDDDGIRPGVTVQSLGQLRTVFKKDGTTTAGNSSQVRKKKMKGLEEEWWWRSREEVERRG